ncbi:S24 family peptidase [Delftia sp. CH05]|uniref:S24 family peptidase n=1 Tax=Delftia sp. CH05 TaxID=2692194 RepID=UPI00135D5F00|nr:S24 family peptidase [Delftia sp. CH05]MXN29992.1 hypothetical protein [Delftia sp. CH05]
MPHYYHLVNSAQHLLEIYLKVIKNATMATISDAALRDTENRRVRLRQWIDEHHRGVQADFVAAHQLNQGEISGLLRTKSFGSAKARNLEAKVGMPEHYLEQRPSGTSLETKQIASGLSRIASPPVDITAFHSQPPADGYARLPVLAEASAGPGRHPLQEVVRHVDVLESYIRQKLNANPRNLKVLTARGSSMTGQIEDGDVMFVQPTNEFTDDGIYILTLDDLLRVKRLSVSIASGNVLIESNDGRRPEELPLKEVPHRLHIQGRVLGSWSLRSFA